ncbi:MAG: ROK family transcriptional regulator [Lachnospiraceae bacterium]|nr:ROK family transcriptional regulator [Lachnospiraceae bacterium]
MESFSLTDIKKKNFSDVYHHIYRTPGCSKQSIATALSMSLPTVTQHLTSLLNEGLIEKCGQLTSSVGRRATAYQAVSTARISIGIEILARKIYIVALNLYGKKECKERFDLDFRPDEQYFEELKNVVMDFLNRHDYKEEQILGIGLGIQGLASTNGDQVTYGKILNCTGLSIDLFSKHFSVPCKFIHDAECASNSELWENPEIRDAIYFSLGYHLGGAIIINGELQSGLTGKSGTFEHMTLIPNGHSCYCGKRGCAECYCSGNSLLEPNMELEDFFKKKQEGDAVCQQKWEDYLRYLAMLINNLHMVIESTVVLGGHITPFFSDEDIDFIKNQVKRLSTFHDSIDFIMVGKCRNDAVSIGAALPFIKDFLNNIASLEVS